ncbi:glycosyltransferase family A protein [Roseinatronobacter bogoriensis]|uniref:Glycosyltransferase family 2 protein n=1 Tax=Roseinatronobacter bogoriensis subsp. barguzinensis TaxID=441209 RepID=A0A2K8KCQ0_9RHOB|nr:MULTISPECIES: glycosyltransferase family A protein [Rhodobaca]ATX67231.1 glycosyltransferase family 2 protein [Rhodobaca barguzinensis]MBB4206779.1 hypothetical protein [Rhodobaca bogoriensis DSM 18756]TDW41523.1 glycosyl transferase family 2 [Rhodobaca barguzinensis]TDY74299.1 glycosyl transferase family 2 [Rhodobaca bogoriensis DSM 18756]
MKEVLVIIPDRDINTFLAHTLVGLIEQTHRDVRVVTIDERSYDGSYGALNAADVLAQDHIIPIFCEDWELAASLNEALAFADTVIIAQMDAEGLAVQEKPAPAPEDQDAKPRPVLVVNNSTKDDKGT